MLECTWNDKEAEIALRRLLLKEQMQEKLLANDPEVKKKRREAAVSRLAIKRIAPATASSDTL